MGPYLCTNSRGQEIYQSCWNDGSTLTFDLFTARSNLLPHAFVWTLYIYMGKMLRIHILDISSIIQLNRNLIMSIRALMRHKIAKQADRKSKMATTATILKINFRRLFSNLRSLWAETCSLVTGWLLDRNKLKLCRSKIQDGCSGSAPLNKMATRAKRIENLQMTSRPWPMAWFQNICTEVFHLQPKLLKWLHLAEENGDQS